MNDIKIFVSHRIELDSETVNNPLYYHVRCGGVDDDRKNVAITGDNTGENISESHISFGEFTVQFGEKPNETGYADCVDGDGILIEKKALDILIELIQTLRPEYMQSAREYFDGWKFRSSNCYILRRDLFYKLCDFQFAILFELEKRLDIKIGNYPLTVGKLNAILYFKGGKIYGTIYYNTLQQ